MQHPFTASIRIITLALLLTLAMATLANNGNGKGKGKDKTDGGGEITTLAADSEKGSKGAAGGGSGVISVPDGEFAGTTTATVNPGGSGTYVLTECYQGGTLVLRTFTGVDANNQATIKLGPTPAWTGGDASCTAEEGYFNKSNRWRSVASTTFQAIDTN